MCGFANVSYGASRHKRPTMTVLLKDKLDNTDMTEVGRAEEDPHQWAAAEPCTRRSHNAVQ